MLSQFKGLVLSELAWGEHDKLLTVLTAEMGKVSILLKGGVSLKNKSSASCMPLCYSEFVTADKGGRPWVREVVEIESFSTLRNDLEATSTALYMCEVADYVCVEDSDESEMLQLILNTLYALDRGIKKRTLLKAAFELRAACVLGFTPNLVCCDTCAKDNDETMYLDVMDGVMYCTECKSKSNLEKPREGHTTILFPLSRDELDAMRYICYSEAKKYIFFPLPQEKEEKFCDYCEKYLINHTEREFRSLEFLRLLTQMP